MSFNNIFSGDAFSGAYARGIAGQYNDSIVWPAIAGVIVLVLVAAIVYAIIQSYQGAAAKIVKGPIDLFLPSSPVVIDRDTVAKSMSATYTLSFYLQIDAVPDMRVGATPLFTWPGVWNMDYSSSTEQMQWTFTQTRDSPSANPSPEVVILDRVPIQRWVQIVIAFEGRSVDLYVNGTLAKSDLLRNLPRSANSSITIVPNNVMGKLAYVQLWPRRLPVHEVAANYTDTSDSQGRPFLGPEFLSVFNNLYFPNLFCPNGKCGGAQPTCSQEQTWEFPYA
jgi:hypothetical protein